MSLHDPIPVPQRRGLSGWLRLASRQGAGGDRAPIPESARNDRALADIAAFLTGHGLSVSAFTLGIAHDYLNGTDGELVRRIDERVRSHQPLSLDWLDQLSREIGPDGKQAELSAMMSRLETSIDEFGKTSREARSATHEYNSALEAHVGELGQVSAAGAVIAELATIAKAMLARTREIEKEMSLSEQRTRALRRKLEEARRAADVDHLTGLPNRRSFEARFAAEHASAREAGDALCVAFCDIDNFKQVNDTHGHEAGARVLKAVASDLDRLTGDLCHVARHGGEEFVILLRGKSLDEAAVMLDRARADLAERRLVNRVTDQPFGTVTFSAGVAEVFAYPSRSDALKAADEALYRAKQEGRNRIMIAAPRLPPGG